MNAEQFFRKEAGFEPDTEIGPEWVPFSNLKDAVKMMEEYAEHKKNDWFVAAFTKPPCLPHLLGTDKEQSEKVLVHGTGFGVTTLASYHHTNKVWLPIGTSVTHWMYCPDDPK